jgi:hypothetical protein
MRRALTTALLTTTLLIPASAALAGDGHNNGLGNCGNDSSIGQPALGHGHGGHMSGGVSSCQPVTPPPGDGGALG